MNSNEHQAVQIHEDIALFREALSFTAAQTGFTPYLIEKDYFCSVLLAYLVPANEELVFKGGTCLAKVHVGFYRLSEDLDFVIPMSATASRRDRSGKAGGLKDAFAKLADDLDCFKVTEALRGANDSTQYVGGVRYVSQLSGQSETIKVEISLREPLIRPPMNCQLRTLLLDPVSGNPLTPLVTAPCIDLIEAFSEKFRAAMTRREVAIRDFYDIDYAVRMLGIQVETPEFLELVDKKLTVPGNGPVNIGPDRLEQLRGQLTGRLKPVLRLDDFNAFDLDNAFAIVAQAAGTIKH
jgi:predicted nucleotidyltransferase component of viral defense system